jgi:hypothetical protein
VANDLGNLCGQDPANPPWSEPPPQDNKRPAGLRTPIERICEYFAPPSVPIPTHIAERQARRCESCIQLLEHLIQPDGTLRLAGLNLGQIARVLKLKFKHAVRALRDLVEIGIVEGYTVPVLSGNRCGHHPGKPRWFDPPQWHKQHPKIIEQVIKRVREYYDSPQAVLPVLNAVSGSERQQRSERREACVAMLAAILHYTDLITLRVGKPQNDGSFAGIPMVELAEIAGLARLQPDGTVCIRRAERAIADLKAAGIVTVHAICEKLEDCTYQGLAAIRTVTRHLFTVFGLGQWLEHERRRAKERRDKRLEKQRRKALANVQMSLGALEQERKRQAEPEPATAGARTGELKSAGQIAIELMKASLKGKTGPPS